MAAITAPTSSPFGDAPVAPMTNPVPTYEGDKKKKEEGGGIMEGFKAFMEKHPIATHAAEGAGVSGALSLAGRGAMAAAPFTGPAAPLVGGVGAALSAAPLAQAGLAALSGGAGQSIREYGKPLLGKATEPAALATELLTPGGAQKAGRALFEHSLGSISKEAERLLPVAKERGFVIEPAQARVDRGIATAGKTTDVAKHNQLTANRLASEAIGFPTDAITKGSLGTAINSLGQRFNQIYSPANTFTIPPNKVQEIANALDHEINVGSAASSAAAKSAAQALLGSPTGSISNALGRSLDVTGDVLKRIRSDLSEAAKRATNGNERFAAANLRHVIDESVEATDPVVAAQLAWLRPKYRAAMTLDELAKRGGIPEGNISLEKLGEMLRKSDRGFTKGQSTHPLAELGDLGETFGMRSLGEVSQVEKGGAAKAAMKKFGLPTGAVAVGEVAGHHFGLPLGAGGVLGGSAATAGQAAFDALRKGPFGQTLQRKMGPALRQPAVPPVNAPAAAVAAGTLPP